MYQLTNNETLLRIKCWDALKQIPVNIKRLKTSENYFKIPVAQGNEINY
jgi:hypothetical protein